MHEYSCGELGYDVAPLVVDFGDVRPESANRAGMLAAISPAMRDIVVSHGLRPLSLGGDHSVTYPLTKALREQVLVWVGGKTCRLIDDRAMPPNL